MIQINGNTQLNGVHLKSTNEYFPELTTDLVNYWKLDETGGAIAYPTIGSSPLTFTTGSGEFGVGKLNNGYDGSTTSSTLISNSSTVGSIIEKPASITYGRNITFNIWIYTVDNTVTLFERYGPPPTLESGLRGYKLSLEDFGTLYKLKLHAGKIGEPVEILGNIDLYKNQWYMITWVLPIGGDSGAFNWNDTHFYVNGTRGDWVDPGSTPLRSVLYETIYGKDNSGIMTVGDTTSTKKFDEISIWDRSLSQTDVTKLYNSGRGIQYPFENW